MRASTTKSPGTRAEACDPARVHPANQPSRERLATNFEQMMTGWAPTECRCGWGSRSRNRVAKIELHPVAQMIDAITDGIEHQRGRVARLSCPITRRRGWTCNGSVADGLKAAWRRWRSGRSPSAPKPARAKSTAASLHPFACPAHDRKRPVRGARIEIDQLAEDEGRDGSHGESTSRNDKDTYDQLAAHART